MPKMNLRNVVIDSPHFVEFDIEATGPEDGDPPGLYLGMTIAEGGMVESFETEARNIRKLRDLVVRECDEAIKLIEGG